MNIDLQGWLTAIGEFARGLPREQLLAAAGGTAFILLTVIAILRGRAGRWRNAAEARQREERLLETARRAAEANEAGLAELRGRLAAVAEMSAARQAELATGLNQRLDEVSARIGDSLHAAAERLNLSVGSSLADASRHTADTLGQLGERLAVLDRAQANLAELSGEMLSLRGVLSDKQARGAFGQGRMEAIIEDGLPRGAYEFQAMLSNGKRPDCLVRLPSSPAGLVIDAKFPLEGFEALRLAVNAEDAASAATQVRTAIARHIEDIARKYRIPGETQDMALMFVPSESIYGDINEHFPDLVQQAHRARVLMVSPNMLMLAVQTMLAVLKDVRMREQAGVIQREVGLLLTEVVKLAERARELDRHFAAGAKDVERLVAAADRIAARGRRIEGAGLEEAAPPAESARPLAVVGRPG